MSELKSNKRSSDETQDETSTDGSHIITREGVRYLVRRLNDLTIETRID